MKGASFEISFSVLEILLYSYYANYESDDVINSTTNSEHKIANVRDFTRHAKFRKVLRRVKLSVP